MLSWKGGHWGCLASQHSLSAELQAIERPCFTKQGDGPLESSALAHLCTVTQSYTDTQREREKGRDQIVCPVSCLKWIVQKRASLNVYYYTNFSGDNYLFTPNSSSDQVNESIQVYLDETKVI